MDPGDPRAAPQPGLSEEAGDTDPPFAGSAVPILPTNEDEVDKASHSIGLPQPPGEAASAASPTGAVGAPEPATGTPSPVLSVEASLAAIQFKADGVDLPSAAATSAPAAIRSRVGDLPAGLAVPAAAISLGFALVLLGALLPMSQPSGKQPLLAIESVSGGMTPPAGYWFALGAVIAGFVSQLIAYPMLARRGRPFAWVLLLLAVGTTETIGFAMARRSGTSISGDVLITLPPVLGMTGGILTALAGLALGFVLGARDGVKCRDCRAVLARESGFCPDCGALLTEVLPIRSRLASAWHSGLIRGAASVLVLALLVAAVALLVLATAPST